MAIDADAAPGRMTAMARRLTTTMDGGHYVDSD
jgi:hypothetical protein